MLGGVRVGAGHPEAVGMVAVAALLGDQLGEAAGMVGRAGKDAVARAGTIVPCAGQLRSYPSVAEVRRRSR
jgi:hypothetical protein